jgi:hypothetical protein
MLKNFGFGMAVTLAILDLFLSGSFAVTAIAGGNTSGGLLVLSLLILEITSALLFKRSIGWIITFLIIGFLGVMGGSIFSFGLVLAGFLGLIGTFVDKK